MPRRLQAGGAFIYFGGLIITLRDVLSAGRLSIA
jgi:hypothetical protein